MEEEQREAMFNAWYNSKIHLIPKFIDFENAVVCCVEYNGEKYSSTCYRDLVIGSANIYNVSFNMLRSVMQNVNNDIELTFKNPKQNERE